MTLLDDHIVVVAGGTGNVGGFIVQGLLRYGATVVVPSRSNESANDFRHYISQNMEEKHSERLAVFVGTISDEEEGPGVVEQIKRDVGLPNAVIALMGSLRMADSLLNATQEDLDHVLEHYLKAHFGTARSLLPLLQEGGGTYVFVNGPLAFEVWSGAGLVSIATAAQHMLFRALANEQEDGPVRITELVSYAFIRDRTTQPGSPLPGEAVGAYAAHLVSGSPGDTHGKSIHLHSREQLGELDIQLSGGVSEHV